MFITKCDCSRATDDRDRVHNYSAKEITVVNLSIDMNELCKTMRVQPEEEPPPEYV